MSDERVVLKYPLDPSASASLASSGVDLMRGWQHAIPLGSRLLSLQLQRGIPCMWWSVPRSELAKAHDQWPLRAFMVVPTGEPGYVDNLHYVGTFLIVAEEFVGHVFCREPLDL